MTNTIIQTIETDLAAAGGWVEAEAEQFAGAAWAGLKTLFTAASAEQVGIMKQLVTEVEADEDAGDGIEETVADVLTLAEQKEMAWVAALPDQALTALVALFKEQFS